MPRTTYRTSVSFEFDVQPVLTTKSELATASAASAASKALRAARKQFKGSRPRSIVICLEKL